MPNFLMLNTAENFMLLNRFSGTWFCANETSQSVLIEFECSDECERIHSTLSMHSSALC